MRGVDQDDLVVFVDAVLVDPVRIEHTKVAAPSADTLLRRRLEGARVLKLVHSLVRGLSVDNTLLSQIKFRSESMEPMVEIKRPKTYPSSPVSSCHHGGHERGR